MSKIQSDLLVIFSWRTRLVGTMLEKSLVGESSTSIAWLVTKEGKFQGILLTGTETKISYSSCLRNLSIVLCFQ